MSTLQVRSTTSSAPARRRELRGTSTRGHVLELAQQITVPIPEALRLEVDGPCPLGAHRGLANEQVAAHPLSGYFRGLEGRVFGLVVGQTSDLAIIRDRVGRASAACARARIGL